MPRINSLGIADLYAGQAGRVFDRSLGTDEVDDNHIFGFIDNPGNTVATIFGVPVGTQFGTAMGMDGITGLAVDIATDPTLWFGTALSLFPVTAPAGAAIVGTNIAKHTTNLSRLRKMKGFLKGFDSSEKATQMMNVVRKAIQGMDISSAAGKELKEALDSNNIDKVYEVMRKPANLVKGRYLKFKDIKSGKDAYFDVENLLNESNYKLLKEAFDAEAKVGKAAIHEDLYGIMLGRGKYKFGFDGPKFLDPVTKVINGLPMAESAAKSAAILGEAYSTALTKATNFIGLNKAYKLALDNYSKWSFARVAGKDGINKIYFVPNEGLANLHDVLASDAPKLGLHRLGRRVFKSESDVIRSLGKTASLIADRAHLARDGALKRTATAALVLKQVFPREITMGDRFEETIFKFVAPQRYKEVVDDLQKTLLSGPNAKEQAQTLASMLDTGVPLNDLWKHVARLEQEGRDFNIFRAYKFKNDKRYVPTRETLQAYEMLKGQYNDIGRKLEKSGVQTVLKDGTVRPFMARENYYTHAGFRLDKFANDKEKIMALKREIAEAALWKKWAVAQPGKRKAVTPEAISEWLASHEGEQAVSKALNSAIDELHYAKFGPVNMARENDFPGYLGDYLSETTDAEDIYKNMLHYFSQSNRVFAEHVMFEPNKIKELTLKAVAESGDHRDAQLIEEFISKAKGEHIKDDSLAWNLVAQAGKWQIATKLTAGMSAVGNIASQSLTMATKYGFKPTFDALGKATKDILTLNKSWGDESGVLMNNIMKESNPMAQTYTGMTDKLLEWYGFSASERFLRNGAAYLGAMTSSAMERVLGVAKGQTFKYAPDVLKGFDSQYDKSVDVIIKHFKESPKRVLDELEKLGLPFIEMKAIREKVERGTFDGFTAKQHKLIAQKMVDTTQFRTGAMDVPAIFNHPIGAFIGIFGKFQYKMSEFFIKEVIGPGLKYIQTGGKEGYIKPLLVSLAGGAAIGEVLSDFKSYVNDGGRPEDFADRLWDNYMSVGMGGYIPKVTSAVSGNDWSQKGLLGANLNDLGELTKGFFEGNQQIWEEFYDDITHPIPKPFRAGIRKIYRPDSLQAEYDRIYEEFVLSSESPIGRT